MDVEGRLASSLAGRYTIEGEIGRGGMATVFSAQDVKHGRRVALKVLLPDISESIAGDRFLREIEISARLNHPNIVPLFDSGQTEGIFYYVMPLQEGESLRDRIEREGPLPLSDAVQIAVEVAGALAHAHDHGIVHRDIKPDNILFSHGQAVIADFGVARALESSSTASLTASGLAVGTPWYMSPEQAEGKAEVDGRSDLYSLGCVLYETVGGEPPFPGKTPGAVIARRLSEKPLPLRILRESVPKKLDDLIQKALQRVPGDRFQTAEDFRQALLAPDLLSGETPQEVPSFRRRVGLVSLGIALVAATALGTRGWIDSPAPTLDPNKVVVFPLGDRGGGGLNGANASLAIIMALEHAEPLRPLDAWDRLGPEERENIDMLSPGAAREIALAWGAGHYLIGAVTRRGDSVGVSLNLYATGPDSLDASESEPGSLSDYPEDDPGMDQALSQLGIRATIALLPDLIDPGRPIDLGPLTNRNPAAIVKWIHGEREYRLSRFEGALDFFEAALGTDSLLAQAAMKGGQAATWIKDWDRGRTLLELALRLPETLPPRHRDLARGLLFFTQAEPDSAVTHIRAALEADPEWSEAWMALGEVYQHFFPRDLVVDSSAMANFQRAAELDPGFHPPLIHLGEAAIRRGEIVEAARYIQRLSDSRTGLPTLRKLPLEFACVDQGAAEFDWEGAVALEPLDVLDAGMDLAAGGWQPACAKAAFRAVLAPSGGARNLRWAAYRGLQGILVSEGRYEEALTLLDEALAERHGAAQYYLVLGTLAGAPWQDRAREVEATIRGRYGEDFQRMSPENLWFLGVWLSAEGDLAGTRSVHRALLRAQEEGNPGAGVLAQAVEGHLRLLSGDTLGAIEALEGVLPRGDQIALEWSISSALPLRHLRLAELYMATGQPQKALRVASFFDHVEPVVFLPFLRKSLQIRLDAARIADPGRVEGYEQRLSKLGVTDRSRIP